MAVSVMSNSSLMNLDMTGDSTSAEYPAAVDQHSNIRKDAKVRWLTVPVTVLLDSFEFGSRGAGLPASPGRSS